MKVKIRPEELQEETINDDFYSDEKVDLQLEDDEISPAEEGFMLGYLES